MPTQDRPTYDNFAVRSLLPAPGWQAVYVATDGTHFLLPVHALGLAFRRTRECKTGRLLPQPWVEDAEEAWEIVGLNYLPVDGWTVCDADSNCCGLLPPEMTLAAFEDCRECHKTLAAGDGEPGLAAGVRTPTDTEEAV